MCGPSSSFCLTKVHTNYCVFTFFKGIKVPYFQNSRLDGPKTRLKNIEKVICDFNKIHDAAYTYEKMIYKGSKVHIEVTCPKHSSFWLTPSAHLAGSGCPKCNNRCLTREEVINRFRAVHGLKYDYSMVVYTKSVFPVKIKCRIHGYFEQVAENHWSGIGCPKCGRDRTNTALRERAVQKVIPLREVIKEFKEKHGAETYDYSHIDEKEYRGLDSKIKIRCRKHGFFEKTASSHKKGRGCPLCRERKVSLDQLILDFQAVHNGKYSYDRVVYKGYSINVAIGCSLHGIFMQTPASHLAGAGCDLCKKAILQKKLIEVFRAKHGDLYEYDRVIYKKQTEKVEIYCKKHKEYFFQTPAIHRKGSGCPRCATDKTVISEDEVFRRFKVVHGERYDYSESSYTRMKERIKIICSEHGEFYQLCTDHLSGSGCPSCANLEISKKAIVRLASG